MTMTMPPFITAMTGMDALSHAVEGVLLSAEKSAERRPLSGRRQHDFQIPADCDEKSLRQRRPPGHGGGACLAGLPFPIPWSGIVHNLGHATGAVCGVPHGICMAILLPYGLEYNMHKREDTIAELLLPMAGEAVYLRHRKRTGAKSCFPDPANESRAQHNYGGRHPRCLSEIKDRDGKPIGSP